MQRSGHHIDAVALAQFQNAGDDLPGLLRAVLLLIFPPADRTVLTALQTVFPEIFQNIFSQTVGGAGISHHALQPLAVPLPHQRVLLRAQFLVGSFVVQQILVYHHVLTGVEHDTLRCRAVTACPARLLVIVFHTLGHVEMEYIAHIGFVDAHAESVGGHDNRFSVVDKILLVLTALLGRQSRMIPGCGNAPGQQSLMHLLHILAGGAVNDAAVSGMTLYILLYITQFAFGSFHAEKEVPAVEAADQELGIPQSQHGDDVIFYLTGGRGGEGADHRPGSQLFNK